MRAARTLLHDTCARRPVYAALLAGDAMPDGLGMNTRATETRFEERPSCARALSGVGVGCQFLTAFGPRAANDLACRDVSSPSLMTGLTFLSPTSNSCCVLLNVACGAAISSRREDCRAEPNCSCTMAAHRRLQIMERRPLI